MERLTFFVPGKPIPQGSKNVSRQGFIYETTGKTLRPWRKAIASACPPGWLVEERTIPASVYLTFIMPRPKSTPKITPPAVKRPDLDKLTRAVLDALTGVVWIDDSQVTNLTVEKHIAEPDEETGVDICICI
jgi:Holliday junction resolvase RusA-like endonuclease